MAQRLKPEVRSRILNAAGDVFAQQGFKASKMADIAVRAEIATSNIYKYFANKHALFDALVTPTLAAELLWRMRQRVRALGQMEDWSKATAEGSTAARALLDFWIQHRQVVLIFLQGAEGTRYAPMRRHMHRTMLRPAKGYLHRTGDSASRHLFFLLEHLFERTLDTLAAILSEYQQAKEIQQAFAYFWRYQLAGLEALLKCEAQP